MKAYTLALISGHRCGKCDPTLRKENVLVSSVSCPIVEADEEAKMVFEMWRLWKSGLFSPDVEKEAGWIIEGILVCENAYNEYQEKELERWRRSN